MVMVGFVQTGRAKRGEDFPPFFVPSFKKYPANRSMKRTLKREPSQGSRLYAACESGPSKKRCPDRAETLEAQVTSDRMRSTESPLSRVLLFTRFLYINDLISEGDKAALKQAVLAKTRTGEILETFVAEDVVDLARCAEAFLNILHGGGGSFL
jgi:hypothetical protein